MRESVTLENFPFLCHILRWPYLPLCDFLSAFEMVDKKLKLFWHWLCGLRSRTACFPPDVYWEEIGSALCGEEGALEWECKDVVGWGEPFTSANLILSNHKEDASNSWVR